MANIPIYNQQVAPPHKPRRHAGISVEAAEGRAMAQFGQQLEQTGAAWAGKLFDLAARNELNQATVTARERWTEFRRSLEQDPDYASYGEKLTEFARNTRDELELNMKLPRARREAETQLNNLLVDWRADVGALSDARAIDHARTIRTQAITQEINNGSLEGVLGELGQAQSQGEFFESDLAKIRDTAIEQLLQNNLLEIGRSMGRDGIEWLLSDDAERMGSTELPTGERFSLDLDARNEIATRLSAVLEREQKLQEETAWRELNEQTRNLSDSTAISRDELVDYLGRVGDKHRSTVQTLINNLDRSATEIAEGRRTLDQEVLYSSMSAELQEWDGVGKAPWNLTSLTERVRAGELTTAQRDKLEADYRATKTEIEQGTRGVGLVPYARNESDIRTRMYRALDEMKDPGVVVGLRDIDEAYRLDQITPDQRDSLVALRDSLREDHRRRVEADKKARGMDREDPAMEAELWRLVQDDRMSSTEKFAKARQYMGNGVPPDKWYQITSHIEELNNRPDWKARMDTLSRFYSAVITAMDKDDDERKVATLESAAAAQGMIRIFRQYPESPEKWDQALQVLLNPATKKELHRLLETRLQARFPGLGRAPEWETLETAREQLPGEFRANVGLQMQAAIKTPEIMENERKILEAAGHKIVDQYQLPSGDAVYATVAIPRDANGVVSAEELRRLRAEGKLFAVVSTVRRGRIEQTIQ